MVSDFLLELAKGTKLCSFWAIFQKNRLFVKEEEVILQRYPIFAHINV